MTEQDIGAVGDQEADSFLGDAALVHDDFVDALRQGADRDAAFSQARTAADVLGLTGRERRTLQLMALGTVARGAIQGPRV